MGHGSRRSGPAPAGRTSRVRPPGRRPVRPPHGTRGGPSTMRRLAWSQLRFGAVRTVALLAGMLLAATAFTVLTAASHTSQLRTTGTVSAHFRAAYDILVRPRGARSALEARTGTVQPNFLSGLYGGITMADYRQIQRVPGVDVAAPVAMVGYTLPIQPVAVPLPASSLSRSGLQLFR